MKRGIFILIVFWIAGWLSIQWPLWKKKPIPLSSIQVLGPLTVYEKILLGLRLDINQLSQQELEALPRIGPSVAKRILEFRNRHGSFRSLESLLNVKGVGPKTLKSIRPWVSNF